MDGSTLTIHFDGWGERYTYTAARADPDLRAQPPVFFKSVSRTFHGMVSTTPARPPPLPSDQATARNTGYVGWCAETGRELQPPGKCHCLSLCCHCLPLPKTVSEQARPRRSAARAGRAGQGTSVRSTHARSRQSSSAVRGPWDTPQHTPAQTTHTKLIMNVGLVC